MTQCKALTILVDAAACLPETPERKSALRIVRKRIDILRGRSERRKAGKKTMPL